MVVSVMFASTGPGPAASGNIAGGHKQLCSPGIEAVRAAVCVFDIAAGMIVAGLALGMVAGVVAGKSCGEKRHLLVGVVIEMAAGSTEAAGQGDFAETEVVADRPGSGMKPKEVDIVFAVAGIGCGTSSCTPVE